MGTQQHGLFGVFTRLGLRFWVLFIVACAVVILLEAVFEHLLESGKSPGRVTQSIFDATGLYQRLVAAPRNPIPRYTAVVEIDPDKDPNVFGLHDLCGQRAMMAKLLYKIATASPAVIVIDKFYQRVRCPTNERLLQAALTVSRDIPVLVGQRVSGESESIGYYLMPTLEFEKEQTSGLEEYVINLDRDTRKLPLRWYAFPSKEQAEKKGSLEFRDTLALVAARAYDSELLLHHPRLHGFIDRGQHPYISFLRKEQFLVIPAGRILTSGSADENGEAKSHPDEKPTPELRRLRGKIVLIGEINRDSDEHASVVGWMPGVYLQANYVEALLDDRYFRPIPQLDYISGFVILVLLQLILIIYRGQWVTMVLLITGLFISVLAFLYLVIMHFGWYINPALVTGVAIAIKVLHPLFSRAEEAVPKQHTARGGG